MNPFSLDHIFPQAYRQAICEADSCLRSKQREALPRSNDMLLLARPHAQAHSATRARASSFRCHMDRLHASFTAATVFPWHSAATADALPCAPPAAFPFPCVVKDPWALRHFETVPVGPVTVLRDICRFTLRSDSARGEDTAYVYSGGMGT